MNKNRFSKKFDFLDASFCTTDPSSLNFPKDKEIYYIPNPVDKSFERLHNYKFTFNCINSIVNINLIYSNLMDLGI